MPTAIEELTFESRDDVVLARLRGEVDLSNAVSVEKRLLDSVPNTATALVLDLSETEYLDSSGIRVIFEVEQRLGYRGQRMELVVPDRSVINRLLLLTQVNRVVPVSSSVEAALQS
jgi:anti-anti-sigma factor